MDGLRWYLLLFGLFVVAGVYLYSRTQRDKADAEGTMPDAFERQEPSLDGESLSQPAEPTLDELPAEEDETDPEFDEGVPPGEQKVVTLRIVARNHGSFAGDELALSLRGIGLRHGKFGIFHQYEGSDEDKVIFSAASLVEPGSFDMANLKEQKIPGISLFMVVPGPVDGSQAFDLMTAAARTLANSLDAELLDESGSTLSIQRERYLREEIIQFQHSVQLA
jgi:cell division protein ZipA